MTRSDKLLARLKSQPKDLSWEELTRALLGLGYEETRRGKTGGSRRRFMHPTAAAIFLHKPHPGNIVKAYALRDVVTLLEEEGLL
jgi:predicted RNA binding protein YcfA (HicA-like mRNA interferase family)